MKNLAGGGARHVVVCQENNRLRAFETGHSFLAPGPKFFLAALLSLMQHQHALHRLAPLVVQHADMKAIASGKADKAEELARQHIQKAADFMVARLRASLTKDRAAARDQ